MVLGSIIALAWWHLADVFFPGAAEKTGQRIFRRQRRRDRARQAEVIRFDAENGEGGGDVRGDSRP